MPAGNIFSRRNLPFSLPFNTTFTTTTSSSVHRIESPRSPTTVLWPRRRCLLSPSRLSNAISRFIDRQITPSVFSHPGHAKDAMGYRRIFFRFIYRSIYVILYLLLLALLLVTPADAIQRSLPDDRTYNVWILAICYVATVLVVAFVYALRLYINKTALASIPKTWVPIDKSDVKKAVYKMIQGGLNRSAAISYEARPRVQTPGESNHQQTSSHPHSTSLTRVPTFLEDFLLSLPSQEAVWGKIEHPGWASPNSPDLPNLEYHTIISELPNLIEAKALTLAPSDPTSQTDPPLLDAAAVSLLQRPHHLHLRGYLDHLSTLGVIEMDGTVLEFLSHYELARFSNRPISEARFRDMMHLFAEMLRSMKPLDPDALDPSYSHNGDADSLAATESDIDNDAPMMTNPSTPGNLSRTATVSTRGSGRGVVGEASSRTWHRYRTAPTTPRSRRAGRLSPASSEASFSQSRRPYPVSQPSSSSLRSKTSSDSNSVIRLATGDDSDVLPYVLTLRETAQT
ncbi:hypothetical protein B0I35DRAFT_430939 [Stachybotrys elegans]|uniref:Defect at low temperature protein 1 n=1 Tax=Stachybotrys elegans TaxID=80388 RepID=A0A8K0WS60_9HYPO|nr:hypothetical protein B0I35DRAFT_430939 [Stachybotrys elegans]